MNILISQNIVAKYFKSGFAICFQVPSRRKYQGLYHKHSHTYNMPIPKLFLDRYISQRKNSFGDACTPQPGEIVFNSTRYRKSETVQ